MAIDDKMLMDLAGQLGMGGNKKGTAEFINDATNKYADKDDDQILSEIMKLKSVLKKDRAAFDKQLEMIKALRPMMTAEQKKKLDGLLKMLEE